MRPDLPWQRLARSRLPLVRSPTRWIVLAMVPSGTIAGHVLGYLMAGEDATFHGAHSQLRSAAWLGAAVTGASMACLGLLFPHRGPGALRLSRLVSAQAVLFSVVEAVEHVEAGHGGLSFLSDPCFRWGLVAQLITAVALLAVARMACLTAKWVRARLAGRLPRPRISSPRKWGHIRSVFGRTASSSSVTERGPPCSLAPA